MSVNVAIHLDDDVENFKVQKLRPEAECGRYTLDLVEFEATVFLSRKQLAALAWQIQQFLSTEVET